MGVKVKQTEAVFLLVEESSHLLLTFFCFVLFCGSQPRALCTPGGGSTMCHSPAPENGGDALNSRA